MCFDPWMKAACVLAHLIGGSTLGQVLLPEHPLMGGLLLIGLLGSTWTFCIGMPFRPIWVPFFPIFRILFRIVGLVGEATKGAARLVPTLGKLARGGQLLIKCQEMEYQRARPGQVDSGRPKSSRLVKGDQEDA